MERRNASNVLTGHDIVPLFVYGSLRKGGVLHDSWLGDIVRDIEPATAAGYALFRPGQGWFPYMCRMDDNRGCTYGDLMWVKSGPELNELVRMEMNAGYEVDLVEVDASYTFTLPALTFVWQRPLPRGCEVVPHNDWLMAR